MHNSNSLVLDFTKLGTFRKILFLRLILVTILVLLGGAFGELDKCCLMVVDGK
jgi:hypothetical protein